MEIKSLILAIAVWCTYSTVDSVAQNNIDSKPVKPAHKLHPVAAIKKVAGGAKFAVQHPVKACQKSCEGAYNFSQKPKVQHAAAFASTVGAFSGAVYFVKGITIPKVGW
ncbi:MAG TPA: hypothetical protein V6D22_13710 [Candidatus Obscuribacterales bacterium]